jgi:hypothetical protein
MAARVHKPTRGRAGPRTAKRPQSARKTASQTPMDVSPLVIDAGVRRAMTAEAAYYRAERRGFEPGHELDDWVAAEADIERATTPHRGDEPSLCGD